MTSEPVIQIEQLLAPVAGDNPAGQDLVYTVWRDLQKLRLEKDRFGESKPVPWATIVTTATGALSDKTKDLRIAAYLAEALAKEHGFAGLRDGLRLLRGLLERFWEPIYPVSRDGSFKARTSALGLLNDKLSIAVKQTPLTRTAAGERYCYLQWEESEQFRIPENLEELDFDGQERIKALKARAADEGRITSEQWRSAAKATPPSLYAEANALMEESWAELAALDQVMDTLFTHVRPGLEELKQAIDEAAASAAPDRDALRRALASAQAELEDADGLATFKDDLNRLLGRETIDPNALKRASARLVVQEAPSLETLKKTFDGVRDLIRPLIPAGTPEPEPDAPPELVQPKQEPTPTPAMRGIGSRQEALDRLAGVAAYFRRAESYNPARNLIERAIAWGDLSLDQWLAQVIEDDKLGSVQERLGIKSNGQPHSTEPPSDEPSPNKRWFLGKNILSASATAPAIEKKPDAPSLNGVNGVNNRQEAVARLTEVAEYFRKAEPHNPALCLVERAIVWNEMPLDEWLAQVIEDDTVLSRLRTRLEIKPGGQQ